MKGSVSNVIAGCFAMAAFVVAVIAGMAADVSAGTVLSRALIAMLVCYPLGMVIGLLCQNVAQSHLETYRQAAPVQSLSASMSADSARSATAVGEEVIEV